METKRKHQNDSNSDDSLRQQYQLLQREEIDSYAYRDHKTVYKIFHELEKANQCAVNASNGFILPVFAFDKPSPKNLGAKKFVICSYDALWNRYQSVSHAHRHYYETILADMECHMHVDAEYYKLTNVDSNETELHEKFLEECLAMMVEMEFASDAKDVEVVVLVSSNEKKVSKHYIFKIKGACFTNNYHCGAFARRLRNRLLEKYGPAENNIFFLWGEKEKDFVYIPSAHNKECYMDMGIYTKRRQFRLYFSTKATSPDRPLLLEHEHSRTNNYSIKVEAIPLLLNKETFMNCFIQRVEKGSRKLICTEPDGSIPTSTSNRLTFRPDEMSIRDNKIREYHTQKADERTMFRDTDLTSSAYPSICTKLLPMISETIKHRGNVKVSKYSPSRQIMIVSTTCHHCALKAAFTKIPDARHGEEGSRPGNCIYFVVDILNRKFWQKCHSTKPGCNGMATARYTMPEEYCKMIHDWERSLSSKFATEQAVGELMDLFATVNLGNLPTDDEYNIVSLM
jgi:hypothetical protein